MQTIKSIRRPSIIGIAVLCAIALCAVSAGNAAAAQRAARCVSRPAGNYDDPHCHFSALFGGYRIESTITEGTPDSFTATNEKTAAGTTAAEPSVLKGHIAGVETAIRCTGLSASGSLTNAASSVSGTGTIEYSGCSVVLPAEKGCKVAATITTKLLKGTDVGLAENTLKIEPSSGTEIASVPIEGCLKERPPKGNYVVEGSLIGSTTAATFTTEHTAITGQGTLSFGGNNAGLESAATFSDSSGALLLQ